MSVVLAVPDLVTAKGLTKRFGQVVALNAVDLSLPFGSVGLLGPNGAGKSTLLRILLNQLSPDAGTVEILGADPQRSVEVFARIGYMPERECLPLTLNAVEACTLMGITAGMGRRDAVQRAHEALDYVGIAEARYRPIKGYSQGMRQRAKLATALVHDPDLLILDEPTNGMDATGRKEMLNLVQELARSGKSMILSTHLLHDAERVCDYIALLSEGRLVQSGPLRSIIETASAGSVEVRVKGDAAAFEAALRRAGLEFEPRGEAGYLVRTYGEGSYDGIVAAAAGAGVQLRRMSRQAASLEEVFLREVGATGERGGDVGV